MNKTAFLVGLALTCLITLFAITLYVYDSTPKKPRSTIPTVTLAAPVFSGSDACAGCHQQEYQRWQESHHRAAMQHANTGTVLGNFANATFDYFGTTSRFYRQGEHFYVETDDAAGKITAFEIRYTFGITPLQQYLVELPDGHIQALSIAWDSRPKEQGGQRWFHLYPDEHIKAGDPLHWTGIQQNWNYMCADCHTTNLRKNYDAATKSYHTTW